APTENAGWRGAPPPPLLVPGDPQDSEAEVGVHPDDVGEDVVLVIVGIAPLRGETGHVPLPGIGMDFRIVHPIPLAVGYVVAEFHVLDAFGRGQRSRSQGPTDFALGAGDDQPRHYVEPSLESDRAGDVLPIPGTARSLDIATNHVQLGRERGEVGVAEMGVFGYVCDGQRDRYPASGKAACVAVRVTRTRTQKEREYRGIVRHVPSLGRS